jgi:hypothetical protein
MYVRYGGAVGKRAARRSEKPAGDDKMKATQTASVWDSPRSIITHRIAIYSDMLEKADAKVDIP